jgi:predicted DNA-binding ribbon-helix-helix protein
MSRIDAPFYETLETLYRNRFMGIALIDDNGHIDANFSASDLRVCNHY